MCFCYSGTEYIFLNLHRARSEVLIFFYLILKFL